MSGANGSANGDSRIGGAGERFLFAVRMATWLLVVLAAPLLLFPDPAKPWVLALVPLILLIQAAGLGIRTAWRRILPVTPLNPAILLLSLALLASLYATTDLAASFPKIAGLLLGLLVFFTASRSGQSVRAWKITLLVFCLLGLAIAGISLVSTLWILKFPVLEALTARLPLHLTGLEGASAGLQPNEVAGALLWVLPVIIGAALASLTSQAVRTHRPRRFFWIAAGALAALFTLGVLFLTQSRSAYLGLAITAFLAFPWVFPPRLRRFILGLLLLLIICGVVLISIVGWQKFSGLALGVGTSSPSTLISTDSLTLREQIWSRAIWGMKDFGLLGMGLNRFRTVFQQLYPSFLIPFNYDIAHAHNELLNAGVELGYLGLIAFLSLNATAAVLLWQVLRQAGREGTSGRSLRWLALGLGSAWLAHFLYGLTDAIALGARPGFLFWFLLALISSLHGIAVRKESPA